MSLKQEKFSRLFYGILIGWLLLLTILMAVSVKEPTPLAQIDAAVIEQDAKMQALTSKLEAITATFVSTTDTDPVVHQSELTIVQQELRERIALLTESLPTTALTALQAELMPLKQQLEQQQLAIDELVTKATQPIAQVNPSTVKPAPTKPARRTSSRSIQPFKVLSVELRGGEQVLSILPIDQASIGSAILLTVGESFNNWKLVSIDHTTATFKTAHQSHRVQLP